MLTQSCNVSKEGEPQCIYLPTKMENQMTSQPEMLPHNASNAEKLSPKHTSHDSRSSRILESMFELFCISLSGFQCFRINFTMGFRKSNGCCLHCLDAFAAVVWSHTQTHGGEPLFFCAFVALCTNVEGPLFVQQVVVAVSTIIAFVPLWAWRAALGPAYVARQVESPNRPVLGC